MYYDRMESTMFSLRCYRRSYCKNPISVRCICAERQVDVLEQDENDLYVLL